MRFRLFAGLVLTVASGVLPAQEDEVTVQSTEVVPGLYMLDGADGQFAGGNMGLLVGPDGVVLIDDGLTTISASLLAAIADISGEPVDFLINTHVHADHTGSNAALHTHGATIIAHDNIRKRLLQLTGDEAVAAAALPQITFSDTTTFHLNGHTAHVFHVQNAHTDGDAVIHFTDLNVIHSGDVFFNKLFPFIDFNSGGSVQGYLAAQDKIIAIANDDTIIIPGHGALATKADLVLARNMLADSYARVKKLVNAGLSEDEIVARNPLADYDDGWSWVFISAESMTRSLAKSLMHQVTSD
ncbi:MAG: MBL fold metallo-hydrolase [Gammaproteobacteria bacterium]|nr:MBL fold metallo-hydrolase [Gammaproteobacteria bacterium]